MRLKTILGVGRTWRELVVLVALPACFLGQTVGCDGKTKATADDGSSAGSDGAAEPTAAAAPEVDVEPPAAVVAEDPGIPLNEAVVGSAPVPPDYYATAAPPEALVEEPPAKPEPSNVWIPGYWWWSAPLTRYVWVTGAWRNPPPDMAWSPGSWVSTAPNQYAWSPGFWAPHGFVREEAVIRAAPPPMRVEVIPARPDPAYFWTPGYYAYREHAYVWVGGSWTRPPSVGLAWIEPRYVGFGPSFFFQPGRWDFAPNRRGTCYLPNINVRPGAHFSPLPVPAAVVSAHAGFVTASAHAIAQGAVRTPSGGYAVHGGAGAGGTHGGPSHGTPSSHGENEPHGAPAHSGGEPSHGGNEPSSTPPAHSGGEPSHGGNEPPAHAAPSEPASTTHLGGPSAPARSGGAPPSHGGSAPPSHGGGGHGHEGK